MSPLSFAVLALQAVLADLNQAEMARGSLQIVSLPDMLLNIRLTYSELLPAIVPWNLLFCPIQDREIKQILSQLKSLVFQSER